ncbi:ion channel [Octadecabacter sp. G9-8]|uniref:Ion channel n=1 Tax=Octadecabacter dasysiphoniae TaxID=2909341 RepID=A0ABS9D1A5_9RHOB|nr:potassium channel family protein [Octadecabacter dasysiphoniae]MCF2872415.1 ion channel [Octadecabacter dasysiphoniae]
MLNVEAKFSVAMNLALLAVTYFYVNELDGLAGAVIVLASFAASMSVFLEHLQGRSSTRTASQLILANAAIYVLIASLVNLTIGIDDDGSKVQTLGDSAYFTLVTFTTLGYGDLQPTEPLRLVSAIQALLGYIYLGLFVVLTQRWMQG